MKSTTPPPHTCFSLFLPRIELEHVDAIDQHYGDYITKVFYEQGFGVVSQVLPMIKTDSKTMVKYYSAIVHFEKWFPTLPVYNFHLNLEKADVKLIHNHRTNEYWWIQKHRPNAAERCLKQRSESNLAEQEERRRELAEQESIKRKQWVEEMRRREAEYELEMEGTAYENMLALV